jgi:hypothetical protein
LTNDLQKLYNVMTNIFQKGEVIQGMVKRKIPNGKLTKQEKELRAQILQVRLYPGEKKELRDLCHRSGMEMSDVVRGLIKTLQASVDKNQVFCIHGQLCRYGLRLNEELPLAKVVAPPKGG